MAKSLDDVMWNFLEERRNKNPLMVNVPNLDALYELYANLQLAGFNETEALEIVKTVITNANTQRAK